MCYGPCSDCGLACYHADECERKWAYYAGKEDWKSYPANGKNPYDEEDEYEYEEDE